MASYASDDLTPTLGQQAGGGLGMRSGTVIEWDQVTGENVIDVDGALFENVAILNTSEAALLAPGDVVKILTQGAGAASWGVLGRFTIPGTPQAVSALKLISSRIIAAADPDVGSRNSVDFGDLTGAAVGPSVTVNVSSGGRALAFWSADIGQSSSFRRFTTGGVSIAVSGATSVSADSVNSLGHYFEFPEAGFAGAATIAGGNQSAMMHLFTGLNAGMNTFTLKYRNRAADSGIGPVEFGEREIAVFAL